MMCSDFCAALYNELNEAIKIHFGKDVRPDIRMRTHNVLSKRTIIYGSERWVLSLQDLQRIQTPQMRFLRSILGITLKDKVRSKQMRKQD
jgi:hypothetical protein